ncbi:PorV/PorQ family protein [bacterium]|nr:PorV/PorQ family protein [bacterium]MBU1983649.1 PorV/PorQ family protein [bacterium]
MLHRGRVALAAIAVLAVFVGAHDSFAATGLAFLEIPVGGRESALGGCGAALISGPTSATYNPAAVAFSPRSVALMHTRHFADTRAQFLGFTVRRGKFAISPHYWGTRVADVEYRTSASRDPISTFDAVSSAVGAAVAYEINSRFAAGVTGRYLYQKIHVESSDGFAMDAGLLARELVSGFTLGLSAQHMGQMSEFASERPALPTALRGGAAFERALHNVGSLLVVAEAQAVKDNTPFFRGGIEYRAPDYVALRAGYVEGLDAQDVSFGLGFYVKHIRLDYAFIPYKENLGEGHRFSLALNL